MNRIILIILLAVNLLAAVIYLVFQISRGQKRKGLVIFLFLLFAPVVGGLFLLCAEGMNLLLFRRRDDRLNEAELSFSKNKIRVITDADIEKEADHVPVEEALLVSDKFSKRQVFLELLKKDDFENSLDTIKGAVENDDMEISHYAATFVTDAVNRYKKKELQMRALCTESSVSSDRIADIRYLCEILLYPIFSIPEQRSYLGRLDEQMEALREENPFALDGEMLSDLISFWEEQGNSSKAEEWMRSARLLSEDDLEAAKLCLQYYYRHGQQREFFELLETVKQSSLELDNEALEWVRYYNN